MARLLLSDALAELAPEVLPADTDQQIPWVNAVCLTFHSIGKFQGTVLRWNGLTTSAAFAVYEDANENFVITLPRNILTVLMGSTGHGDADAPCLSNVPIRGHWWAFNTTGPGAGGKIRTTGLHDLGDGFTTFRDFSAASYLRIKTEVTEAVPTVLLFRGLDENGLEIYTGAGAASYQGVELDISTALTTTTTQQFIAPPVLVKKPVTRGPVRLYSVLVATGVETLIAEYAAGEKNPSYRRYGVAGCNSDLVSVHALVKRRHVPVVALADEIIPSNVSALELGLMGRRYDLANDPGTAAGYWGRAYALLNSELGEYLGGAVPRIQFEKHLGLTGFAKV